jgi:hypothetical protein
MLPSCDVGDAEVPRWCTMSAANGDWLGRVPGCPHMPGMPDEVGRGLLGGAEAEGVSGLDRCTYAAGISVHVNPVVAAVVAVVGPSFILTRRGDPRRRRTRPARRAACRAYASGRSAA